MRRVGLFSVQSTQPARRHAYIRGIDVPVHVEIAKIAVHLLSDKVCQPSHRKDVTKNHRAQGHPRQVKRSPAMTFSWILAMRESLVWKGCALAETNGLALTSESAIVNGRNCVLHMMIFNDNSFEVTF